MENLRSTWRDYGVYLAVRCLVCAVQALSWSGALALARGLAWLTHRLDHRHRRVAEENLRHAFPNLDDVAITRLTRATYVHLLTMAVEMIRMPRVLHRASEARYIHYTSAEELAQVVDLLSSGRPILVLTGHFGNWEIINYMTGLLGFPASAIARRMDNPFLERFVERFRQKSSVRILDKNRDYAKILEVLSRRGILGIVGDQDAGERGLFVPFLGRPASTFKSVALLSLEYSAPIMVLAAARIGHPMKYRLYMEDVILPEEFSQNPDAVRAITQRYSDALASVIRRYPEQYFWVHRRWKHQPKAAKAKKAA